MKGKRYNKRLSLPAIRAFRESIANGKTGSFLIGQCEAFGAGSVVVRYRLKDKPFVVTVEARRLSPSETGSTVVIKGQ